MIVPLSTRNAESTMGALPSPAMSLAPSYRTTGAGPLDAISTDGFEHATSATNPKNAIAWRNMAGPYGLNTYSGAVVFAPLWQQFPRKFGRYGLLKLLLPGGKRPDFRRAVDPREHAVARLLDLAQQPFDVPPDELALPVHDLPRNQDVAHVPGIHHRHNRAGHIVHRPGVDVPRVEHDDVGFLARRQRADLVQNDGSRPRPRWWPSRSPDGR